MDINLNHFRGKVAVVTGASAGIGEAIAEALVNKGLQVVGLARRLERLEHLSNLLKNSIGKFIPLQADVSKESDIALAFKWINTNVGPIYILINNAGVIRQKGLTDGDPKSWKEVFDTNVLGLCIATKLAVNSMTENKISGHIIHMNSVAGHGSPNSPELNVYPASKCAVTALTESLRQELNLYKSGIKVTSISPGAVKTELLRVSGGDGTMQEKDLFDEVPTLNPQDIADSVIYVLSTPPHVQVHELIIKPIGETV